MPLLALLISCTLFTSPEEEREQPSVEPVSQEDVRTEQLRISRLDLDRYTPAVDKLLNTAYGNFENGVMLVSGGTDSTSVGEDAWRSCQKLKPEGLGLRNVMHLFADENLVPCGADNPDGFVTHFVFLGEPGFEAQLQEPQHKNVVMRIGVSTAVILSRDPAN